MGHRVYASVRFAKGVFVSWSLIFFCRYFLAKKFQNMLEAAAAKKAASVIPEAAKENKTWLHRFFSFFTRRKLSVIDEEKLPSDEIKPSGVLPKLRPDMIRRMNDAPKPVNPSGWVSEDHAPSTRKMYVGSSPSPKLFVDNPESAMIPTPAIFLAPSLIVD